MNLGSALDIVRSQGPVSGDPLTIALVCGFTPLHLSTFVRAHLIKRFPERPVEVQTGLFDDIPGSLQRIASDRPELALVVLEWADLDPRLSLRRLGSWDPAQLDDILTGAAARLGEFERLLGQAGTRTSVALTLPTLPLPPVSHATTYEDDGFKLDLRGHLAEFARRVVRIRGVHCLDHERLDRASPAGERLDPAMELRAGFPYTRSHAATLAGLLVELACPAPRKKGLISDLDNTLWRGILGEIGASGVSWDLDSRSQIHGLYQRLLAALGASGVLMAVA
ncbi:MAG: HAD family hydrolase, partial [Myxococcota bacterium]